jgi:hypothetical protein
MLKTIRRASPARPAAHLCPAAGSILGGSSANPPLGNIGGGGLDPNTGFGLGGTSSQQTGTSIPSDSVSMFNTCTGQPVTITDAASQGLLGGQALQTGLGTASTAITKSEADLAAKTSADTNLLAGTATGLVQSATNTLYNTIPRVFVAAISILGIGLALWMFGNRKASA